MCYNGRNEYKIYLKHIYNLEITVEEIRCSWSSSREAIRAALEAVDEAMAALARARAVCQALQRQSAAEALQEWDKLFPEYREE